jgi:hypothetical protein
MTHILHRSIGSKLPIAVGGHTIVDRLGEAIDAALPG